MKDKIIRNWGLTLFIVAVIFAAIAMAVGAVSSTTVEPRESIEVRGADAAGEIKLVPLD